MIPKTVGHNSANKKNASVICVKNDALDDINIKGKCFMLTILHKGTAYFQVNDMTFCATSPCFICFDEKVQPILIKKHGLVCDSIYFHPTFLNVNMTFDRLRENGYEQLALIHDMFLLKPFTDNERFVFPIHEDYVSHLNSLFSNMEDELTQQYDWYWTCRSRSYFMEIILMLEQAYGITGQALPDPYPDKLKNPYLKKAVIYIQSHYQENITLGILAKSASMSHTSLIGLFKSELNTTPIEYLWKYRISVAKKQLEFTNLPVKDIAVRCGFKTIQHFSRKFEKYTSKTPTDFRNISVAKRKAAF